jgi:hypothetical protein
MASINLNIAPMQGYTATERAEAISAELLKINMPIDENCASRYVFGWTTHPTTGECVLHAQTDYKIWVHPQNNLTNLIALMPDLPQEVQAGLVQLIQNSETITFGQLLTGEETTYTDEELEAKGFYNNKKQQLTHERGN